MPTRVPPQIIQDVGFDFDWDEKKVWKLKIPVEEMRITELEWMLDIPFWNTPNGYYDLKPRDVLARPTNYPAEHKRILAADLTHPIDIMLNKGRWLLLDGLHRLAKAKLNGHKTVNVRKVPTSMISAIQPDEGSTSTAPKAESHH